MKVSIITTSYNRAHSIKNTIESVLAQDYDDIEHIIIDGASTDGTLDVVNQYKDKISKIFSEPDTGIYNALNKGIQHCTGDVVGLLHSDDVFYDSDTISKIAAVFKETNADIVYANGQYVDADNAIQIKRIYPAKKYRKSLLYFGWIPLHTTIFVRKAIFEKYGLYREEFYIASDYEMSLRWFTNPVIKKVFLNNWVVKMCLGGKSTDMRQQKKKSAEDLIIIKEHGLLGYFTLFCKIGRKIPQYLLPRIKNYN